jgi:RNA polymerase sigma-70 factor (ECF subfamily)
MNMTSISLLDRLKSAKPDAPEWRKLTHLYLPLIRYWLGRVPSLHDEADDLAQEVLVVLLRELPLFERQRSGSFRAWLRQITVNCIRTFLRDRGQRPLARLGEDADNFVSQLEDPNSDLSRQWDRDHDKHVFQKLLALVQPDFEPNTWRAFVQFAIKGAAAAEVAQEMGLSECAVIQARFRVLKRLREEAGELMD